MIIDRRRILGVLGAGAALPVAAQVSAAAAETAFRHSVASGDPLARRVVIWTRLTVEAGTAPAVTWQVAADPDFARVVREGAAVAEPARDHTVKVDVDGLTPGREYWYRFLCLGEASPVGRTRTLPVGPTEEVRLAVASCSLHPGGLFNAYDAIARLERVDAVVHLGDYIYEYGAAPSDYGMGTGVKLGRLSEPAHEIRTLADYRRRHAQYKADPDLQAAHARAAWICVWDDHESANDAWLGGAENHEGGEGDWAERRAAALRAYYEWMPIREPQPGRAREAIQRSFDFGDLARLVMVETRLQGRAHQLDYARDLAPGADGRPDVAGFKAKLTSPDRRLLDDTQEAWLAGELAGSTKAGQTWQVLGNQVVMARVAGPDLPAAMGAETWAKVLAGLPADVRPRVEAAMQLFRLGMPMNLDAWDGYPVARERLYGLMKQAGARPIVLAGDSHAFWVDELKDMGGARVAAEFGVTSITSPSWGDSLPGYDLGAAVAARNDEVLFNDQSSKGFLVLSLTREAATAELVAVSTVLAKPYDTKVVGRWRVRAEAEGLSAPEAL